MSGPHCPGYEGSNSAKTVTLASPISTPCNSNTCVTVLLLDTQKEKLFLFKMSTSFKLLEVPKVTRIYK
jgi:hypothetical protein